VERFSPAGRPSGCACREFKKQHINISFRQMEVYLKNLQGQEYKMVPVEPETKTIVPAPTSKPRQEPPPVELD
jgi:potassium efflux system protein